MILGNKCDMEDKRQVPKDKGDNVSKICCLMTQDVMLLMWQAFQLFVMSKFVVLDDPLFPFTVV